MKCRRCGYEWIAVHPVCATKLECPWCGEMLLVDPLVSDEATWEELGQGFIDYPEPSQTHGADD